MNKVLESEISSLPLVVGVDLGGIQIRAAVLRGRQQFSEVGLHIGADSTPEHVIPLICDAIRQAVDDAYITIDQITAIGVAVPGLVDNQAGIVYFAPNLSGWDHTRLRDRLEEHFKKTIFIDNDANAAALGEYLFGAGQGCNLMVYLTVSTGFGGSVIINGQVMRGASGTAMEIGHMTIRQSGERCNCGNIGCLETIASGLAIVQRANEALRPETASGLQTLNRDAAVQDRALPPTHNQTAHEHDNKKPTLLLPIDVQTVAEAAEAGKPAARAIIKSAADAFGVALVNIIHIFNPSMIILGGNLTQIGPILMAPALRIVDERTMKVLLEAVRIEEAQLGAYVGLVGAGALVYYNMGIKITSSQQEP